MRKTHQINLSSIWNWHRSDADAFERAHLSTISRRALGKVSMVRKFSCPTGVGNSKVDLALSNFPSSLECWLNEEPLETPGNVENTRRIEITKRLLPHNEIRILADLTAAGDALSVHLEIELPQ